MNQYDKFITTGQSAIKLQIAIEEYFTNYDATYESYIRERAYPSLVYAVKMSDYELLRKLMNTGWINHDMCTRVLLEIKDIPVYLTLMLLGEEDKSREIYARFYQEDKMIEISGDLGIKYPFLRIPMSCLKFEKKDMEMPFAAWGNRIFYNEAMVSKEGFCHMMIHFLYNHMERARGKNEKIWNLSCDIAAGVLTENIFSVKLKRSNNNMEVLKALKEKGLTLTDVEKNYYILCREEELARGADFAVDDHRYWTNGNQEDYSRYWKECNYRGLLGTGTNGSHRGLQCGSRREKAILKEEQKYDFSRYLRRFMTTKEEMMLDLESFSYSPYLYGLEHLSGMPLVEPLEYTECAKVEELVIAIDTSGSCKKGTIEHFLTETKNMLTNKANFFRKMNVHVIQCDSMIQHHDTIHSIEDWNHSIENLTISGRGGTDFRPVFTYIDSLCQQQVLHHLRGLLYFTDGDGIYPAIKPSYETAFVFENHDFLKYDFIPDWIVRLCLEDR